ncbi:MAG: hypothetical protein K0Q95_693 [Bacteroidota bacterium]|jgi:hypothetical protein|nr:hypothetical protein [Bacteroidota bacterium]
MKKTLLSLFTAALLGGSAFAQCTPNVSCIPSGQTYGICPDSATGMAIGTVGTAYTQVMSMKVPADGTDFGYPGVPITNITITSVDSLAPGLSYVCSPSGCVFPGNSQGCILISGTPTTPWNHQVIVNATASATFGGFPVSIPQANKQYRSIVLAVAGIESMDLTKFEVSQNSPNPFSSKTEINFTSPTPNEVELKVFNMLGAVVFSKSIKADKGLNAYELDATSFSPGIYVYSVKNGDKTVTKRMIVSAK